MKFGQAMVAKAEPEGDRPATFELGYSPALDGLRGLSILAVLGFNGHLSFVRGGFIGVDIFFVLSGFLITSLLVQEHNRGAGIRLRNFYFRRALRLLPALFGLMSFCAAYATLFQSREKALITWKGILYTLFYVANWAQIDSLSASIGALSHAWSLSVEEQFYILWPLLLIALLKLRKTRIVAVLLILIAVSVAWSAFLWQHQPNYLRMYFGSDTRANELLIGCLAALLVSWGSLPKLRYARVTFRLLSVAGSAGVLYSIFAARYYSSFVYNGGFALISLGVAAIIIDVVVFRSPLGRAVGFKPLVWIGKISYGLYLWHFPIFYALRQSLASRVNPFVLAVLCVVAVFVIATLSHYFLEKPFLKLRRRYGQQVDPETSSMASQIAARRTDKVQHELPAEPVLT